MATRSNIKKYAIIGLILSTIIGTLSQCTGIKQELIWDLLDSLQRELAPGTIINDFIIKDPEKLDRRIKRDVDKAIDKYNKESNNSEQIILPAPIIIDEPMNESECYSEDCKALGPPMRICSPWVEGCVDSIVIGP